MHFAEAIAVLVTRIFAVPVADCLVLIAPGLQTGVEIILVRVDQAARDDAGLDDRACRNPL